ncbi:cytochrome P450 [Ampelomyces quisqualis]|uniref:Cytochrome P450 n=1 Tax=Ampelomyces quisqualis TaxID=50730 RepID=A0A6A5QXM9_AMPQU|nr:cytochrome P450 [Ampelomyces quisqualis]
MYAIETPYYPFWGLFLVLCSSCAVLFQFLRPTDKKWSTKKWVMPPTPPGVPVLGNLLQMMQARRRGAVSFIDWLASLKQYGELVTLHMGSQTWVILNSDRVVTELIAKRGKITNERPHMPIASDLISNGNRIVIRQEKEWREGRRVMHQLLSGSNLKVYARMQELESVDMLRGYLREPKLWYSHNYRYATSVLYRIIMGYPLNKTKAELDDYQRVTMEFFTSINRSWVDFFPELSKLPHFLQPWRRFWTDMGAFHHQIIGEWWKPIKTAVTNGTAPPSFVRDVLLHPEIKYTGTNEEAMYLAASIMAAGGDNTRMSINIFVMAMVTRPEVQKQGRDEVDRLCTDGESLRLPCMSDLSEMPYVASMIKEVMRWRPTVPIVPPHQLTENLQFEGYSFPAGTSFVINSIGLSSEFENAQEFQPERWIDGSEARTARNFWAFGGGRRTCVGSKVAEQALFIAFARLLYCFELVPIGSLDDKKLNHQTVNEPFPVKATVRSPEHAKLIEEEASKYESSFSTFGGIA